MFEVQMIDSHQGVNVNGINSASESINPLVKIFVTAVAALILFTSSGAFASSAASIGYNFHAGPVDNSITNASSYSGVISSEGGEKAFRITYGIGGQYSSALFYLNSEEYSATIFGGEMRLGLSFHALADNFFSPIFAVNGVFGANVYKLADPPTGASASEMSFQYGYEGESGMSLKFGRKRLRLTGAYRWIKSSYRSTTITLNAMSFRLGMEF